MSPGETPVKSASAVIRNVEMADKASNRYINQAWRLLEKLDRSRLW